MTPLELLKTWPGWEQKTADEIISCPAFRVQIGERTFLSAAPSDMSGRAGTPCTPQNLDLSISFDDEPSTLSLYDSPAFPELHELWPVLPKLPPEIILALVEKECGSFLQSLENTLRRRLSIKGLSGRAGTPCTPPSDLSGERILLSAAKPEAQEESSLTFSLTKTPWLVSLLGTLDHLDLADPAITSLTRPAEACYAEFSASTELKEGDILLLRDEEPKYIFERNPEFLQVLDPQPFEVTFSELLSSSIHLPPPPQTYLLSNGLAATLTTLCGKPALKILPSTSTSTST